MANLTGGAFGLNTDNIDLASLLDYDILQATSTTLVIELDGEQITFSGFGFTYDADGMPNGGTVTNVVGAYLGELDYTLANISVPVATIVNWALTGDNLAALQTVLGGDDVIDGTSIADLLRGWDGADTLSGFGGGDELYGSGGSDSIVGGDGNNYLRGEEGDDWIVGGADTDDAHGNMGADTVQGGAGDDWVVGGKDNDLLYGEDGHDVSLGNIGNDTIDGGAGDDVVRGGKDDDVVSGGAGDDWISGDRGTDTLTGGAGADNFHVFDGSGVDRVTDFSVADGDQVWLLGGTQWSAAQVGADTVVTVTGAEGGQLVLVGVQLSALPEGWIFG